MDSAAPSSPAGPTNAPQPAPTGEAIHPTALPTVAPGADLTPKQRAFAEAYAIDPNASAAYRAGYPGAMDSTCRREGGKLKRDPRVVRYVEHLLSSGPSTAATVSEITQALGRIAFFDYSTVLKPNGTMKPVDQWPAGAGLVIQGLGPRGDPRMPERIAALRVLAEMRGAIGQAQRPAQDAKATFVFNFGGHGKKGRVINGKATHVEPAPDQSDVAQVGPVPARLLDVGRATADSDGSQVAPRELDEPRMRVVRGGE